MNEKTCCVTGRRKIPSEKLKYVMTELEREITLALVEGYRMFITGFAQGADLYFAQCVIEQREKYPDLFLEAALPFAGRVKQLQKKEKELLAQCDGIHVVCEEYQPDCYFQRNRYMVDKASRVIAVYDGEEKGGTFYTISYRRSTRCFSVRLEKSQANNRHREISAMLIPAGIMGPTTLVISQIE